MLPERTDAEGRGRRVGRTPKAVGRAGKLAAARTCVSENKSKQPAGGKAKERLEDESSATYGNFHRRRLKKERGSLTTKAT